MAGLEPQTLLSSVDIHLSKAALFVHPLVGLCQLVAPRGGHPTGGFPPGGADRGGHFAARR